MAQLIQFRRRIPGTAGPAAGVLAAGEPAVAISAVSATAVADLYVGDGTNTHALVSASRQVEVYGNQTIAGNKTFTGDTTLSGDVTFQDVKIEGDLTVEGDTVLEGDVTVTTANLTLDGGDPGDVLTTDGAGNVSWEPLEPGGLLSVNAVAPLSGNGTSGSALGVTSATTAQINTGTDAVYPINSAGLRTQLGAQAADLTTTAKTVVPAINELDAAVLTLEGQIGAISGALRFVGNYDADQSEVTSAVSGTLTVGNNLPAASATNEGWYVIVTEAGTPAAPAPTEAMQQGDWIVSAGTGGWVHVPLYHAAVTAANVGITQINAQSWTTVQQALAGIYGLVGNALTAVDVDGVSILGDGTSGDPLEVGTIDGGTY